MIHRNYFQILYLDKKIILRILHTSIPLKLSTVSRLQALLTEFLIESHRKQHNQRLNLTEKIFYLKAMSNKKDKELEILNTKNHMEGNLRSRASRQ